MPMKPQDSCSSSTMTLRCSANYVVIVKSASYGVAQIAGSCAYTPGDCVADAMNAITCTTDAVSCVVFATRKKLPQCSDKFNDYLHVEFDCVPLSMDDPAKEYNVCQNGTDITSDYGIIKSPGYPTQFQTTTAECFRSIQVPSNKTIRLWLTDLYIGSTLGNCVNDHVYVVDSIQTYRHCSRVRYSYPYLCSSTIIIQYFVKSQFSIYRGMRMYYDIIDRPANDNCPNSNGTITTVRPTPDTTTTINQITTTVTPTYVLLGIASPTLSFQLCKGQSSTIQCPVNYGVVTTTNIFGVTQSGLCEDHDAAKHCVVTTAPTFVCRQSCTYFYPGNRIIPSCGNKIATYQYVDYQCIPTKTELISPNTSCPLDGSKVPIQINRRGRFQSLNYPNLKRMNCTYRLKTDQGNIMNIYGLDVSLNGFINDCKQNKITFIEDGESEGSDFCEQRSYSLLYSSCSNELDFRYIVNNEAAFLSSGVELYIESQARPSDWTCGKPVVTSPQTTIRTTPFTTPTAGVLVNESVMYARDEVESNICFGRSSSYSCPLGYTFMIIGAFYGVKKQASNQCEFVQGDCTQEALATITQCRNDVPNCYLAYSTRRRLAYCSDNYADYLHITSQCIPSRSVGNISSVPTYDICDTNNPIDNMHGIISSPSFPNYRQTTNECKRRLNGVLDRILKIWINEMAISSGGQRHSDVIDEDSGEPDLVIYKNYDTKNLDKLEEMHPSIRDICVNDYLIINAPHVAYVYCGTRKLAILPICTTAIDIQYKTSAPPNLFYKGFKLYFEWIPKPIDLICPGISPVTTTITPSNETSTTCSGPLELSPIYSSHVCLGTSTTLTCPCGSDYVLAIIETNYAVTGTGLCEIPSLSHCRQEASLGLTCTHSCFVEYDIPKPLIQCGSQNADYINIDYECVPTRLPNHENPIDICGSTSTSTIALNKVMMVSPQYPTLGGARTCSKKIEAPSDKIWMIYIVDLFLEGQNDIGDCNAASLTINDGNDKVVLCGLQQPGLVMVSCGNVVELKFISTHQALGYRGFKVYSQTIDLPGNWACKPPNMTITTTTTRKTSPPTTTVLPPSLQIPAYGGTTTSNGTRQYCKFPFTYQGNSQSNCLTVDPPIPAPGPGVQEPWCSLTSNFDTDRQWGFCDLSVTDTSIYDICRGQLQTLRCPPGYVIDIITADYAAKPDGNIGTGACVYDTSDCFQSDSSTVQNVCAGKPSCTAIHFAKTLVACQNRPSAYLHIDYTCIPNDISSITTYNLCDNSSLPQGNTRRGYLTSPNFPNTPSNIDCTFNLQTLKPYQDIYVYVLDMDLNSPNLIGQDCAKDRFIVSSDNNVMEMCGRSYTNFLLNTCHSSVSFQLIRTSDARGRGVKLYFEFRERSPQQICPEIMTTISTPRPSPPTGPSTTTLEPSESTGPSPRYLKTLCFPDVSSLFGTNNFQCQTNYVLVILRAFYGRGSRCDYSPGDCTSEADNVYRLCSGKQKCSVPFLNPVTLPECNKVMANYLLVEYQCLPTPTIVTNAADLCTGQINDISGNSGLLKSPSYPTYAQTQCANVSLTSLAGSDLVIYMYLIDISIGLSDPNTGECLNDYLELTYQCNNQAYTRRICGTRLTELLFSTCSSTDKIFASYNLVSQDSQTQRGFALLYHLVPTANIPTTKTTIATTTTTKSTSTTPAGIGPVSTPVQIASTCVQQSLVLRCNQPEYVLVIHKVQLATTTSGSCSYSVDDCFEDRTNLYNTCGGKLSCFIFPPLIQMKSCNNSRSNYLYAEYQCIPTRPKLNLDTCSSVGTVQKVQGGAIISSLNYTSEYKDCKVELQSNPLLGSLRHKAFRVYILTLNLPITQTVREQGVQCGDNDPSIEINDIESGLTRLCGNSHTRYLLETCSNTIELRFRNHILSIGTAKYKGFEIYIESIENEKCRPTPSPVSPTQPFDISYKYACGLTNGLESVRFGCTPDFGLVFFQSYHFATKQPNQCDITDFTCLFPSEQPRAQCAGQQDCVYTVSMPISPQSSPCQADSTGFYFQCLPMKPSTLYSTAKFCWDTETSNTVGFIETPGYPNTYQNGKSQCTLTIRLPNNSDGKKLYIYIIELSLRDGSISNPPTTGECVDSIKYTDGDATYSLCGKIDQPVFEYYTDRRELNLTLNIVDIIPPSQWSYWQGARLFYMIDNQTIPSPSVIPGSSTSITTTTTRQITRTPIVVTDPPSKPKPKPGGLIAGIIVAIIAVVACIVGYVMYRRNLSSKASNAPTVIYGDTGIITVDGMSSNGTTTKRGSIKASSLKGPATGFTSPFYKKSKTTENQEVENATNA
ncbi:unnamed protein product [Rotaria magnacalcarata]|uniref:Uncharacterized protein n=11 Tax=Rotaria magnacalcarata TaxID=392030 RepID=A0A815L1M8_9BILA|nr:unnamed protein product [Rotaria magnacalcarata]